MIRCQYRNEGSRCILNKGHKDEADTVYQLSTPSRIVHVTEDKCVHIIYPNKEKAHG